jgi:UDP-N-acetylglucosamine 2-epimerase (non-hydrolysing)
MKKIRLHIYYGTRPEFIKLIPVISKIQNKYSTLIDLTTISTGQHIELLTPIEKEFGFKPDVNLHVLQKANNLEKVYATCITQIGSVLAEETPHMTLAQGDTATVFAAAFASFLLKIPFSHVEAGIRTGNIYSPFPEEVNRELTSRIAALHFCPTINEKKNLVKENISIKNISVTGNTVIDTQKMCYNKTFDFTKTKLPHSLITQIMDNKQKMILMTQHRRENMGEKHENIFTAVKSILKNNKNYYLVYPLHANPNVRKHAIDAFKNEERTFLVDPISYISFINLMAKASVIVTDSGGLQEEAPSFGIPAPGRPHHENAYSWFVRRHTRTRRGPRPESFAAAPSTA